MAKSLRNRILIWHLASLACVSLILSATFYFSLQRSRYRQIDTEMEGAAQSLIAILKALPPFELDPATRGMPRPPEDRMRGRPRRPPLGEGAQGQGGRVEGENVRGSISTTQSQTTDFTLPPPPPPPMRDRPGPEGGRPRGPEHLMRSLVLPPTFLERHRRLQQAEPYFAIQLRDGSRFAGSPQAPETLLEPTVTALTIRPLSLGPRFPIKQEGHWREMWVAGPEGTKIVIGRSTKAEDSELRGWLLSIFGFAIGGLLLSLVGATWMSRGVLKSLDGISLQAAKMSPDQLNARIDLGGVDRELQVLAQTLNQTFERLGEAFQRQRRFTSDASHELRTPLSVILGNIELALVDPDLNAQQQESLEAAQRAAKRMQNLMEHLLVLARADAGKLDIKKEEVDLAQSVRDCCELLQPLALEKDVTIHLNLKPTRLRGDSRLLSQVAINLVSNAIYYNRAAGEVWVTVETESGGHFLKVRDSGEGIPATALPHIFERFYQIDPSRSRLSTQGSEIKSQGLGLAITESIVKSHGGTITVTSDFGRGSEFVVRFPISTGEQVKVGTIPS
jgi:two-component system OmpR family sensor kinase